MSLCLYSTTSRHFLDQPSGNRLAGFHMLSALQEQGKLLHCTNHPLSDIADLMFRLVRHRAGIATWGQICARERHGSRICEVVMARRQCSFLCQETPSPRKGGPLPTCAHGTVRWSLKSKNRNFGISQVRAINSSQLLSALSCSWSFCSVLP